MGGGGYLDLFPPDVTLERERTREIEGPGRKGGNRREMRKGGREEENGGKRGGKEGGRREGGGKGKNG